MSTGERADRPGTSGHRGFRTAVLALFVGLSLQACRGPSIDGGAAPGADADEFGAPHETLHDLGPLKDWFEREAEHPRVVALLSPT